jgi:hypothetical protein
MATEVSGSASKLCGKGKLAALQLERPLCGDVRGWPAGNGDRLALGLAVAKGDDVPTCAE